MQALFSKKIRFARPLRTIRLQPADSAVPVAPVAALSPEQEKEIYERGRREAEKAMAEERERLRKDLLEVQTTVVASLRAAVPQVMRDCEAALANLALEVAQRLVPGIAISAAMVEGAIREALAQAEETAELHIQIHPDDLELLRRVNSPLLPGNTALDNITIQASPEISRGGCMIRTRFGIIDARRETKIEMLRQMLEAA